MGLRAIGPLTASKALADQFLNKRSKEQWSQVKMLPPEEQVSVGLTMNQHQAIIAKIVDVVIRHAGCFHVHPKPNLDTMQCAKVIVELLVLFYHAGLAEFLGFQLQQAYSLEPEQVMQFFKLFDSLW
jgi:hypothetical protein